MKNGLIQFLTLLNVCFLSTSCTAEKTFFEKFNEVYELDESRFSDKFQFSYSISNFCYNASITAKNVNGDLIYNREIKLEGKGECETEYFILFSGENKGLNLSVETNYYQNNLITDSSQYLLKIKENDYTEMLAKNGLIEQKYGKVENCTFYVPMYFLFFTITFRISLAFDRSLETDIVVENESEYSHLFQETNFDFGDTGTYQIDKHAYFDKDIKFLSSNFIETENFYTSKDSDISVRVAQYKIEIVDKIDDFTLTNEGSNEDVEEIDLCWI